MPVQSSKPAPPNDDKRWKMIGVTMRRNGYAGHALIETLHSVQDAFGYLDEPAMQWVAESLNLPLSKVYGVATFYHLFTLKPKGKHTCVICTGTACYIKGADKLVDALDGAISGEAGRNDGRQSSCRCSALAAWELVDWPRPRCWTGRCWRTRPPDDLVGKIEELS